MNASVIVPAWLFALIFVVVVLRPQVGRFVDRIVSVKWRALGVRLDRRGERDPNSCQD